MNDDREARFRELEPKTVYEERESNSHMSYSFVNKMNKKWVGIFFGEWQSSQSVIAKA